MKVLLCVTGASLAGISLKLIENLAPKCELHAIFSEGAKQVLKAENGIKFDELNLKNIKLYDDIDISAPPASGSFGIDKTIIAPCSINTLGKVACGISDTLITRACAVALKEQKRLVLGVREMPLSAISLRQMSELATLGVIIAPPIIANYAGNSKDEMINFIIGKWLDALEIEHNLYKRWGK